MTETELIAAVATGSVALPPGEVLQPFVVIEGCRLAFRDPKRIVHPESSGDYTVVLRENLDWEGKPIRNTTVRGK